MARFSVSIRNLASFTDAVCARVAQSPCWAISTRTLSDTHESCFLFRQLPEGLLNPNDNFAESKSGLRPTSVPPVSNLTGARYRAAPRSGLFTTIVRVNIYAFLTIAFLTLLFPGRGGTDT